VHGERVEIVDPRCGERLVRKRGNRHGDISERIRTLAGEHDDGIEGIGRSPQCDKSRDAHCGCDAWQPLLQHGLSLCLDEPCPPRSIAPVRDTSVL
jgi:hypothetical protein